MPDKVKPNNVIRARRGKLLSIVPQLALAQWAEESVRSRHAEGKPLTWPRPYLTTYALSHWDPTLDTLIQTYVNTTHAQRDVDPPRDYEPL
jgi:hypothetical protein